MCLAHSAGASPMSTRLADMQDDAPAIGRYVRTLLSSEHHPSGSKGAEANPVHVYMDLLQQLLCAVGGETLNGLKHFIEALLFPYDVRFIDLNYLLTGIPVMYCLLEVVSVCPEKLALRFIDKIDWIKVSYLFVRLDHPVTVQHH